MNEEASLLKHKPQNPKTPKPQNPWAQEGLGTSIINF